MVSTILRSLLLFVEKQESGSATGYLVSHTASAYVLDQNGNLFVMLPYGTTAVDMTNDLTQLLKYSQQK